jgi:hypothetical protein
MLQVRLGLPDRAGVTQVKDADCLREGAFNPGAVGIAPLEVVRLLTGPGGVQSVELSLGAQGERPRGGGRPRAAAADRAGLAGCLGKLHPDNGLALSLAMGMPADPALSARAGDRPCLPIDRELFLGEALARTRLPVLRGGRRTDQITTQGLTLHQEPRIDLPGIHQMLTRQETLPGKVLLHLRQGPLVGPRGDGGLHLGHQVG